MSKKVRVRFAPSPTGPLHIGGVRTALFNYLFAKKNNGTFILRIEDTDQKRYVEGAENYIVESLKWCGIEIDEGISKGGDCSPYRQSERKEIYKQYADQLIDNGFAYYAFDTPEELEQMRNRLTAEKSSSMQYDAINRKAMTNSLTLSDDETKQKIDSGIPYVIRYKMPENEELNLHDIIRGDIKINTSTLDDKVLFKSDGMPTYHLANVVDDYLMKISHVIRGEEWLPSMPLHVLLYKSFDWENEMPEFAHLPLLLKPNGNGKLSKRDGDKLGFPVFPLQWTSPEGEISTGYKESGYFSDAFINMLAFLGWNPGTEQEIFSMDALINDFSLERVNKAGAKFDPEKAKWFNKQYLANKSDSEVASLYQPILKEKGVNIDDATASKICSLVKDRINFISELWEQTYFFFSAPTEYNAKVVKKRWKENTPNIMLDIKNILSNLDDFTAEKAHDASVKYIEEKELGMGAVMNAFRLVIVGAGMGPDLFTICEIIGKDETIKRIENGVKNI